MNPEDSQPLKPAQINRLLRYWLGALRFEEAMQNRPRAQKAGPGGWPEPNLDDPRGNQPYFKMGRDEETDNFIANGGGEIELPIAGERAAFFGRWLRKVYRAQDAAWSTEVGDGPPVIIGFPTVFFPRRKEMATLLRFRGRVQWLNDGGDAFEAPSRSKRRKGQLPKVPQTLRICAQPSEDTDLLPFSIDGQLLTRSLGVPEEDLAEFYEVMRGCDDLTHSQVMATLADLLESEESWEPAVIDGEDDEESDLNRLLSTMKTRLAQGGLGPTVYPIGLVNDGAQIQTTHHLQRELSVLQERRIGSPLSLRRGALWSYLSGQPASRGRKPMMGLFADQALTDEQRSVCESFLGSTLTAVQGPPGTGKTKLILDLAAHALVENVKHLAEHGIMGSDLLVVTSTNNRAVDNVLEPLNRDRLPTALRMGSQAVTLSQTVECLQASISWLDEAETNDPTSNKATLDSSLETFRKTMAAIEDQEASRLKNLEIQCRRAEIETELMLLATQANTTDNQPELTGEPHQLKTALDALNALSRRMDTLTKLLAKTELDVVIRAGEHWRTTRRRALKEVMGSLSDLGTQWQPEAELPPSDASDTDAWRHAVDLMVEHIQDWIGTVEDTIVSGERNARHEALEDELNSLPEHEESTDESGAPAESHHALYAQALMVRSHWARLHTKPLRAALSRCLDAAFERRSLRRILDDDDDIRLWVRRLFPVFGSTLLSLGNVFTPDSFRFEKLIIDEGGQCHPAYAVSGLMRCQRALIIGDVNQLEPVIQLSEDDEIRAQRAAGIEANPEWIKPYSTWDRSGVSAQSLADRTMVNRPTLRAHFRCQPQIINLSDALCGYGLEVRTLPNSRSAHCPMLTAPVLLSSVSGEQLRFRSSWFNQAEVRRVVAIVERLLSSGIPWSDIAVITPYVGQLDALRNAFRSAGIQTESELDFDGRDRTSHSGIATGTVHRFQGGERSIIIFSTVTTQERSLRFLNHRVNLVNVAISRARDHLIVVGDPNCLSKGVYSRILLDGSVPLNPAL